MDNYTIVLPAQAKQLTDMFLPTLCLYREARGESLQAKQGVAWSIRNRVDHPSWYGKTWVDVVTKYCQYTSMNPPKDKVTGKAWDPNLIVYGSGDDPAWQECVKVIFDVRCSNVPDPTGGATFYFDKSMDKNPPVWAKQYVHTADIGNIHFYKVPNA